MASGIQKVDKQIRELIKSTETLGYTYDYLVGEMSSANIDTSKLRKNLDEDIEQFEALNNIVKELKSTMDSLGKSGGISDSQLLNIKKVIAMANDMQQELNTNISSITSGLTKIKKTNKANPQDITKYNNRLYDMYEGFINNIAKGTGIVGTDGYGEYKTAKERVLKYNSGSEDQKAIVGLVMRYIKSAADNKNIRVPYDIASYGTNKTDLADRNESLNKVADTLTRVFNTIGNFPDIAKKVMTFGTDAFEPGSIKGLIDKYQSEGLMDKEGNRIVDAGQITKLREEYKKKEQAINKSAEAQQKEAEAVKNTANVEKTIIEDKSNKRVEAAKKTSNAEGKAAQETKKASNTEKKSFEEVKKAATDKSKAILNAVKSVSDFINKAVNKVVSAIRIGIAIITKVITGITKTIAVVKNTITRIISLFGNFGNRIRSAFGFATTGANSTNKSFNALKGTAVELYAKLRLLQMALQAVFNNEQIRQATTLYQSVYSLKNIVGGQLTQDTIDWAYSMEKAFGLSAKNLIMDLNELTGVLYGLGMKANDVAVGSKNILMISRYLAFMGAAGGDVDQVMEKLISGMKGMTQSVDDLGLSVREAQMDSYLKDLKAQGGEYANISTSFANLNEEARVYIRYASLIQQFTSKYNLTGFADALDTVTGRISIVKESFKSLNTTIGQLFVKMFANVAQPIIIALKFIEAQVIRFAGFLQSIFGFDFDLTVWQGMNDGAAVTDKVNGNLEDTKKNLDGVAASADKASGALASFDKIESINTKSGSGGGAGTAFDYSSLMTDALGGLNELAAKSTETYMDRLQKKFDAKLKDMKESLSQWIKDITGRKEFDIQFGGEGAKASLKSIVRSLVEIVKNSGITAIQIGLKFADDIDLGEILNKLLQLAASVMRLAETVTQVLNPVLNDLYDKYLSPLVVMLGDNISSALDKAIAKVEQWNYTIKNMDASELSKMWSEFKEAHPTLMLVVDTLKEALGIVRTLAVDILWTLLKDLGAFARDTFLPWLNEQLERLGNWVDTNKDKINELLKSVGNIAWEAFKKFVDVVAKLVDIVVQHPEAVVTFFASLMALKIASWFGELASNIGLAIMGMKEFMGMFAAAEGVAGGAAAGAASGGIAASFSALAGPIAIVVAEIVALALAFADLWKTSETFRNSFIDMGNKIKTKWEELKKSLFGGEDGKIGAFSKLWESIKTFGSALYDLYSATLKPLLEQLFLLSGRLDTELLTGLMTWVKYLVDVLGPLLSGVIDIISGVVKALVGLMTLDMNKIAEGLKLIGKGIVDGLWEGMKASWNGYVEWCKTLFEGYINFVKGIFGIHSPSTVFSEIGANIIAGLLKGIQDTWESMLTAAKEIFSGILEGIKGVFSGVGTWFGDRFREAKQSAVGAWSNVSTDFAGVVTAIETAFSGLKGKLSTVWTDIKDNAKEILGGIGESAVDIYNKAKEKAKELLAPSNADERPSGTRYTIIEQKNNNDSKIKVKNLPEFATGGTISKGQVFVANEAGAELVGNITGGSGAEVANNSMIIEAMRKAIFESAYNAIATALSQYKGFGASEIHNHIAENGLAVIDESTLRELAERLAPYQQSNSINIANTAFELR